MDESAVAGMKRGSVVIDLAGATGGNVRGSKADEIVERDGITIMAPTNLPATCPCMPASFIHATSPRFLIF
jgi:NAD/NADP transhydrogenase alpha subunit